jgi:hypothetical protein
VTASMCMESPVEWKQNPATNVAIQR